MGVGLTRSKRISLVNKGRSTVPVRLLLTSVSNSILPILKAGLDTPHLVFLSFFALLISQRHLPTRIGYQQFHGTCCMLFQLSMIFIFSFYFIADNVNDSKKKKNPRHNTLLGSWDVFLSMHAMLRSEVSPLYMYFFVC